MKAAAALQTKWEDTLAARPAWLTIDDTDYLGDLYQQTSIEARKGRALVQTPPFVAEFLLSRTLMPAMQEFGVRGIRMIDPSCGPGHLVVRAFLKIFIAWKMWEPDEPHAKQVLAALDSVHGIDLDPVCVALCRMRLCMAAAELLAAGNVPPIKPEKLPLNIAVGDALLDGRREGEKENFAPLNPDAYAILQPGRYHAVVGNPPYIVCPDPAKNKLYRERWKSCHMKFSLGVPFTELMFELAVSGGKFDSAAPEEVAEPVLFGEEA